MACASTVPFADFTVNVWLVPPVNVEVAVSVPAPLLML